MKDFTKLFTSILSLSNVASRASECFPGTENFADRLTRILEEPVQWHNEDLAALHAFHLEQKARWTRDKSSPNASGKRLYSEQSSAFHHTQRNVLSQLYDLPYEPTLADDDRLTSIVKGTALNSGTWNASRTALEMEAWKKNAKQLAGLWQRDQNGRRMVVEDVLLMVNKTHDRKEEERQTFERALVLFIKEDVAGFSRFLLDHAFLSTEALRRLGHFLLFEGDLYREPVHYKLRALLQEHIKYREQNEAVAVEMRRVEAAAEEALANLSPNLKEPWSIQARQAVEDERDRSLYILQAELVLQHRSIHFLRLARTPTEKKTLHAYLDKLGEKEVIAIMQDVLDTYWSYRYLIAGSNPDAQALFLTPTVLLQELLWPRLLTIWGFSPADQRHFLQTADDLSLKWHRSGYEEKWTERKHLLLRSLPVLYMALHREWKSFPITQQDLYRWVEDPQLLAEIDANGHDHVAQEAIHEASKELLDILRDPNLFEDISRLRDPILSLIALDGLGALEKIVHTWRKRIDMRLISAYDREGATLSWFLDEALRAVQTKEPILLSLYTLFNPDVFNPDVQYEAFVSPAVHALFKDALGRLQGEWPHFFDNDAYEEAARLDAFVNTMAIQDPRFSADLYATGICILSQRSSESIPQMLSETLPGMEMTWQRLKATYEMHDINLRNTPLRRLLRDDPTLSPHGAILEEADEFVLYAAYPLIAQVLLSIESDHEESTTDRISQRFEQARGLYKVIQYCLNCIDVAGLLGDHPNLRVKQDTQAYYEQLDRAFIEIIKNARTMSLDPTLVPGLEPQDTTYAHAMRYILRYLEPYFEDERQLDNLHTAIDKISAAILVE